jgi:prevent-host-death family protein
MDTSSFHQIVTKMSTLIVPISDLRRKTSDVLKTMSQGQVVYITQHGRPAAVLVDYDCYEARWPRWKTFPTWSA